MRTGQGYHSLQRGCDPQMGSLVGYRPLQKGVKSQRSPLLGPQWKAVAGGAQKGATPMLQCASGKLPLRRCHAKLPVPLLFWSAKRPLPPCLTSCCPLLRSQGAAKGAGLLLAWRTQSQPNTFLAPAPSLEPCVANGRLIRALFLTRLSEVDWMEGLRNAGRRAVMEP